MKENCLNLNHSEIARILLWYEVVHGECQDSIEDKDLADKIIHWWVYIKTNSQSAKPGQPYIAASPCPADTHTPCSRHPGANDGEVLEDMICPDATRCSELYKCTHSKPHAHIRGCDFKCMGEKPCTKIPDMWLDKGLPKMDKVRKHVLNERI